MNSKKRSGRKPKDIVFTSAGKPPQDSTARFVAGLIFEHVKNHGSQFFVINGRDGAT